MLSRRAGVRRYASAILVAIAIGLGATAPAEAQTTVVLNAPNTDAGDVAIRAGSYESANFEGQILATRASTHPDYRRRVLIKFDTHNRVPEHAKIQSAKLTLTVRGGNNETRTLRLYYLEQPFDTSATTWERRKSGMSWSEDGGTLGPKYAEATVTGTPGSKVTFDVTALVQDAVNGTLPSRWTRVLILDPGSSTSGSYREFYPLETSDKTLRPTLTIVYGGSSSGSGSSGSSGSGSSGSSDASTGGSSSGPSTSAPLPGGWSTRDVGTVQTEGSVDYSGGQYLVNASGRDVWDKSDAFRFVYRSLTGDGEIVARVQSLEQVHDWTKAGVMMRESLNANSRHAFMLVSPGRGLAFQRRPSTGGPSEHASGGTGKAPQYVKLTRSGTTFRAYRSSDGKQWTQVGSDAISMEQTIYVGLAVTAKVDGALAAATFTNVSVKTGTPTPPPSSESSGSSSSGSSSSGSSSGGKQIRVLHWNIHHGVGTDNKYDINRLATWMADLKPDIISLNEVEKFAGGYGNEDQAARLASLLTQKTGQKWYHHFAQRYGSWSSKGQGNAVLSRLPFTHTDELKLSCNRSAAIVGVLVGGRAVNFVSTHLDDASAGCRATQVGELVKWAGGYPEQRIIAGDMNDPASSDRVATMKKTYVDAWAQAVSDKTADSYSGNSGFGATRNSRIDYVFHSKGATKLVVKSARVHDTRDSKGKMPSDHKPLVVTYDVK